MLNVLVLAIEIYTIILIARMLMSWFPISPGSPVEPLYRFVHAATEPPLAAIRSVVPPLSLGMGALDLSPLILIVALQLLAGLLAR